MLSKIGYRVETFDGPSVEPEPLCTTPAAFDLLLTDRPCRACKGPSLSHRRRTPALVMSRRNDDDLATGEDYGMVAKPIDIADPGSCVGHSTSADDFTFPPIERSNSSVSERVVVCVGQKRRRMTNAPSPQRSKR